MGLTIFAERMKATREEKGLKQNELAKMVGVTPTTISAYEKSDTEGNGKKPTLENAQAIAKALGCSLDWLSGMTDDNVLNITDFTVQEYLRSIVTVLLETSSSYDANKYNITLNNWELAGFAKKIMDLIKVYRDGTLDEEFFKICVDKAIEKFSAYKALGNCLLDDDEYFDAWNTVLDIANYRRDFAPGILSTSVYSHRLNSNRTVKIMIDQHLKDAFIETGRIMGDYRLDNDNYEPMSATNEDDNNGEH